MRLLLRLKSFGQPIGRGGVACPPGHQPLKQGATVQDYLEGGTLPRNPS
jgi:hypothetical protein